MVAVWKMLKYIYYINSTYFLFDETINISIIHKKSKKNVFKLIVYKKIQWTLLKAFPAPTRYDVSYAKMLC